MYLAAIVNHEQLQNFYNQVYGKDPNFKDNKSSLLPLVCGPTSSFYQHSRQEMLAVRDEQLLCQCVTIRHNNDWRSMNLAFFEALPDCHEAVRMMLDYAEATARKQGCTSLTAGMDGHLNYSFGFSLSADQPPGFGDAYNPAYYADYFPDFQAHTLTSLQCSFKNVKQQTEADYQKFAPAMARYSTEPGRTNQANLERMTRLSNQIFAGQPFYFAREIKEDQELFSAMKPILSKTNLIFIKDGGTDIGFIFWYLDYNELVPIGGSFGAKEAVQFHLLQKPKTVKMVEIGLLPEYQNSGLVLLALHTVLENVKNSHPQVELVRSSWIADSNQKSMRFAKRYLPEVHQKYVVFEKML